MKRRIATRAVMAATTVVVLAAGWLNLAPAELGGRTEYVIVQGSSMEPLLQSGDLAILRSGGRAGVGDVVLYRDEALDVGLLHRVIRAEGDRIVLKGDSNDFLDDARPAPDELRGSLWFSIPHAGAVLARIREPLPAALIVFVLTLFLLAGRPARPATGREVAGG